MTRHNYTNNCLHIAGPCAIMTPEGERMANIIVRNPMSAEDKINQMRIDAAYDVADNDNACVPDLSSVASIKSRPALNKVPKAFLSNDCAFNCAYCGCRSGNDCGVRYANTPKELAYLAVEEAKRKHHGIFVTSAIYKNADYTQELIIDTVKRIRNEQGYTGYVHAKVMPGADLALIKEAGKYSNRLSVNIEVAKSEGYARIAKQKNRDNILAPMSQISELIAEMGERKNHSAPFATTQTTQLMAGSTGEDDRTIITLSKALYNKFNLKRIYYTSFHYSYHAKGYDELPLIDTPAWRTYRLYQADRLIKLYGFTPDEITPQAAPNLESDLDPKIAYALRNMHLFPVEVNKADYEMLLRVPGIGIISAKRILEARSRCRLTFELLRAIGVPLARSVHFITCDGKMQPGAAADPMALRRLLAQPPAPEQMAMELYC